MSFTCSYQQLLSLCVCLHLFYFFIFLFLYFIISFFISVLFISFFSISFSLSFYFSHFFILFMNGLIAEVDEYGRAQTTIVSAVMRHETFFSCVQAACYILCFHGMEIANVQKKSKSMQKKWQTVLTCTLHPLRFCLQSVRVEFIRLEIGRAHV